MFEAKTLLELAGADLTPAAIGDATLVLIDIQEEYRSGPIAVTGFGSAAGAAARLLHKARESGSPVIHVAHKGRPGGKFDRDAERGQIGAELAPLSGEAIVEKSLPNAFAGTNLHALLENAGRKKCHPRRLHDPYVRQLDRARRARSSATASPSMPKLAPRATCRTGPAA